MRFDASMVRFDVLDHIIAAYAMPEGWRPNFATHALAVLTDRQLRALWRKAGTRAVGGKQFNTELKLGPARFAKAWNIARYLGEVKEGMS